ncbi:Uncharacterised protein [Klebsiella pneumoniae]|nr:Uncharacterised protein [Klebsiella pneumoniae]
MRVLGEERLGTEHRGGPLPVVQAVNHQADEDHDDRQLDQHEDGVEIGDQVHALDVDEGHDQHEHHHPDPRGDLGEQCGQVDLRQQRVDHRQEQVVQQRRPADHEADMRIDRPLRVGIGRACGGELADQLAVADRGEQHAGEGQQVGGGHVSLGNPGYDAEGVEDGHRGQVGQPDHDDLPQLEGLAKLGSFCGGGRIRHGYACLDFFFF